MTINTKGNITATLILTKEDDNTYNHHIYMSKQNDQFEDILDELSVIKESVETYNTKLANIEALLSQLASNEKGNIESKDSTPYISEVHLKEAIRQGMESYFSNEESCKSILSDESIKLIGDIFISMYATELHRRWKQLDAKEEQRRKEYFHKRALQGINTIDQMAEWASEYSPEIQRTIRFIGLKILDKDEPVDTAHTILKIWGNALQAITNPKPAPPPTLKTWWLYKWQRFKASTDKWGMLQWYLIILGLSACILFSALYQDSVMKRDRLYRMFYQYVIKDESTKKEYLKLDSVLCSKSLWGGNHPK